MTPFFILRRDEDLYFKRVIGFAFGARGRSAGKSADGRKALPSVPKIFRFGGKNLRERSSKKNFYVKRREPYLKPTQVGEASSLRRTSERWSRNSAKKRP